MQTSRSAVGLVGAALQVLLLTTTANGQETTRVSVDSSGVEGNDASGWAYGVSISADGRTVAFASFAWNLVAGDTNRCLDVFVHDRATGITERVSVDSSGAQGNGWSIMPSISADGQVVAFSSQASNLVAGDTNGTYDIFVHDRATGITERVSVDSSGAEGNDFCHQPSISADGQIVAFISKASNLDVRDAYRNFDVFVHDRATRITEMVSVDSSGVPANSESFWPSISADGQIVAFTSWASNLVAGDTNGYVDVFVHDRSTGLTERVSVDSSGAEGNEHCNSYNRSVSISADGQIVAFRSYASNLVAGDTNGFPDVFVHDRSTGLTERVSVDSSGAEGNDQSDEPSISADGRVVTISSGASNLVASDTNGFTDVFVHDRVTGLTERVNVDSSGAEANDWSYAPSISADGQIVAFTSWARNLVASDTNGVYDVFAHERCELATWTNYGAGFPGTNGVPSFTSQADPVLGTTVTFDLANSYGNGTVGLVLVGYQETLVPTNKGGDLLVVPAFTLLVTLAPGGISIDCDFPSDESLCGLEVFAQTLELDPGAAKGMSFTAGLKLVLGH